MGLIIDKIYVKFLILFILLVLLTACGKEPDSALIDDEGSSEDSFSNKFNINKTALGVNDSDSVKECVALVRDNPQVCDYVEKRKERCLANYYLAKAYLTNKTSLCEKIPENAYDEPIKKLCKIRSIEDCQALESDKKEMCLNVA
ncbi:MAG: hypothetical protein ACQESF_03610, partial [Nanobdellota archaeon]